jgi:ABC-type Fe3+/spermidine/putrescine transport system ATPase subunit
MEVIVETRVLELEGLSVEAEGHCLLRDVSLTLEHGELLALTGPSGCGKTTLLRSVAGIIDPAAGQVTLLGLPAGDHGWPAYRRRVIYVSQRPVMFEASVRENLARPFGYSSSAGVVFPEQRAAKLLELLGVGGERMDQQARSLSVGQQLRVSFVRALLLDPVVLLLDEPASALDEVSAGMLREQLAFEVEARGLSALLVTHDRSEASQWCHRRVDLREYACIEFDDEEGADG